MKSEVLYPKTFKHHPTARRCFTWWSEIFQLAHISLDGPTLHPQLQPASSPLTFTCSALFLCLCCHPQGQTWFILRLFLLLQEYCKYLLINVTCRILIESRFPLHFLSFTARVKVRLMLHRRSCSALQEILTSTISFNLNYSRDEKLDGGSGTETHRHCSMHVPTHSISCLNCSQPLYNPGPSSSEASWGKMWTYRFL